MKTARQPTGEGSTRSAVLRLLKSEGAMDSAQLAEKLGPTAMAVRQHLYALLREKFVTAEKRPPRIGRPTKFWHLTPAADQFFPASYAELTLALMDPFGDPFG